MMEEWRAVVGFEKTHEVSNKGRVRSRRKVLSTYRGRSAPHYELVSLYSEGKLYGRTVHSLVAAAFIGPRPEGQVVCHGELGSHINTPDNLSYGSLIKNYSRDRNRDHNYRSSFPGVDLHKGRWRARLRGKHLGYFSCEELASEAYENAQ